VIVKVMNKNSKWKQFS